MSNQQEHEGASTQRSVEIAALRELVEGQEHELRRVSRELQDGLGGMLTTLRGRIAEEYGDADLLSLVDRTCGELRRIANRLLPQQLGVTGLTDAVCDLVVHLRRQGLPTDLEVVGQPGLRLPAEHQVILLRILRELGENAVKHARANRLFLQLLDQPQQLLITVEDDGIGYLHPADRREHEGEGLRIVCGRVTYLGGDIQFDGSPHQGTTITLSIPL